MSLTTVNNKGLLPNEPLQGIGSILGFECDERPNKTITVGSSLRRTLSADMSSKKWLTQHGFSPLKRIASSEELQIEEKEEKKKDVIFEQQQQQPGQFDIWCSILSQKPSSLPPPYVHPLVKQSKNSLTVKSLEICTENLGSESGSDEFSSYPSSEISSDNEELHDHQVDYEEEEIDQKVVVVQENNRQEYSDSSSKVVVDNKEVVNHSCSVSRKSSSSSSSRSFPPPLNSLSKPGGIQMKPHRKDGRLVLEAVSVPKSHNYFHAQRQDGRLVLSFINSSSSSSPETKFQDHHYQEEEEIFETDEELEFESDDDEEIEEKPMMEDRGIVLEMSNTIQKLPTGLINVHRSALMVNKFTAHLTNNRNNLTTWSLSSSSDHQKNKFEKLNLYDDHQEYTLVPQSLPSPPPPPPPPITRMSGLITSPPPPKSTFTGEAAAATAVSFNTYEYCWRRKSSSSSMVSVSRIHNSLNQQSLFNPKNNYSNNNNNNNNNYNINNNNKNNFFVIRNTSSSSPSAVTEKNIKVVEEKQSSKMVVFSNNNNNNNGEKDVVDHFMVNPAYFKGCKQEPRRSLLFWEPYCIATS